MQLILQLTDNLLVRVLETRLLGLFLLGNHVHPAIVLCVKTLIALLVLVVPPFIELVFCPDHRQLILQVFQVFTQFSLVVYGLLIQLGQLSIQHLLLFVPGLPYLLQLFDRLLLLRY